MPALPVWFIWTMASVMSTSMTAIQFNAKEKLNVFLMGFFRDVGRAKAYQRRYGGDGKSNGLILFHQVLVGKKDDELLQQALMKEAENDNLPIYTRQELWDYGNGGSSNDDEDEDLPILISIFGRIFDVSEGEKFYGAGGPYSMFAGRDVTYSLCTGCKTCTLEPIEKQDLSSLTERQLREGKRWLSFFQLHDKYPQVGNLQSDSDDNVQTLMNTWIDQAIANDAIGGGNESDQESIPKIPILETEST